MSEYQRHKNSLYEIWEYEMKLPNTPLTLRGHSRGSERTGFYIPQLKLFLDAGIQSYFNPTTILITHCHTDHSFALPMLLTGLTCPQPPTVCVPAEDLARFENFNNSYFRLARCSDDVKTEPLVGVTPASVVDLGKNHWAEVFRLAHSVPTCGYGIYEKRQRLREQYKGLTGKEIAGLRKSGTSVSEDFVVYHLAFLCDTTTECFTINPRILSNYPIIMVECTFIDKDTVDLAKESRHTHWDDLRPIVVAHPKTLFILIHFSMRYQNVTIPDRPENVVIWEN